MMANNLFKLAASVLAMTLAVQARPIEPRNVVIGDCQEISDPSGSGWKYNYLEPQGKEERFWSIKKYHFFAGWNYDTGSVPLFYGKSPTGNGVMGIAWTDPATPRISDVGIWKYYALKEGQSCTAHVGKLPAQAHQKVFVVDSVQY